MGFAVIHNIRSSSSSISIKVIMKVVRIYKPLNHLCVHTRQVSSLNFEEKNETNLKLFVLWIIMLLLTWVYSSLSLRIKSKTKRPRAKRPTHANSSHTSSNDATLYPYPDSLFQHSSQQYPNVPMMIMLIALKYSTYTYMPYRSTECVFNSTHLSRSCSKELFVVMPAVNWDAGRLHTT